MGVANNYLSQANYVGQGFDILGSFNISESVILPLLDPMKAGTIEFNFLGTDYTLPSYIIPAENTDGIYWEDTAETREDIQNSFSVKAGVKARYGAFSAQVEAAYGSEFAQSSQFFYSYRNFFSHMAQLSINIDEAKKALSDRFLQACDELPTNADPENLQAFSDFFNEFGVYFVSKVSLGASFQYYVALSKVSTLKKEEISASVKLEFNALTFGGGISSEVKNTKEWKSYSSNRHVNITVTGGDPAYIARLGSMDPSDPSSATVALYDLWAQSIDSNPAIADFSLNGIWDLIPDENKSNAALQAFESMQLSFRPRLFIETSAERGTCPTVILQSPLNPEKPPKYPLGYQLIVLDRTKVSPEGVLLNRYYGVPEDSLYERCEAMYDQMMNDIKSGNFNTNKYVLILVSYGWSSNAPPNSTIYPFLLSAGGGSKLINWVEYADPGSYMEAHTGTYILVGIPQMGNGTGVENYSSGWYNYVPVLQEVYFYKMRGSKLYLPSIGPSSKTSTSVASLSEVFPGAARHEVSRTYLVKGKSRAFVKNIEK
ncbi:MAC/Perforin domain protein [uncultured archaeon]|nr:MAC/Perforin domain protein [uncultured archaeon]